MKDENIRKILELELIGIFVFILVGSSLGLSNMLSFGFFYWFFFYFPYVFWFFDTKWSLIMKFITILIIGLVVTPSILWVMVVLGIELSTIIAVLSILVVATIGYLFRIRRHFHSS